jgi:hypothetical protein
MKMKPVKKLEKNPEDMEFDPEDMEEGDVEEEIADIHDKLLHHRGPGRPRLSKPVDPNAVFTSFSLPRELHKRLKIAAIFSERTQSEIVAIGLKRYLNRLDRERLEAIKKEEGESD